MLRIVTYRSLLYTRQEVWFYEGGPIDRSDNDLFYQALAMPDFGVENVRESTTVTLDLTRTESSLLGNMTKGYRAEIRRAQKEGCSHHVDASPDPNTIRRYLESYLRFARPKGLAVVDERRLMRFSEDGCLCLTTARSRNRDVTRHSYLVEAGSRARLLYSHHEPGSVPDEIRGRIHKYHHWADALFFKRAGVRCYDFGGLNPAAAPGIARFKMRFGGGIERHHDFQRTRGLYALFRHWRRA